MSTILRRTRSRLLRDSRRDLRKQAKVRANRRNQIARPDKWARAAADRRARIARAPYDTDALIAASREVSRITLDLVGSVAPNIVRSYRKRLEPVATQAFDDWPVDTGLSRSLLTLTYMSNTETLEGVIGNAADYAFYIRFGRRRRAADKINSRKHQRDAHVWTVLVRRPTERAVDKMVDDIGEGLTRGP